RRRSSDSPRRAPWRCCSPPPIPNGPGPSFSTARTRRRAGRPDTPGDAARSGWRTMAARSIGTGDRGCSCPRSRPRDSTTNAIGDRAWKELLERHHALVRDELGRFRGREIDTAGDGFLAIFDGPARAVRCAMAIVGAMPGIGLEVRAGVHTGEVELMGTDVGG